MKAFVTFFFLMLMAMTGSAQNQKGKPDLNNKEFQKLNERTRARYQGLTKQLSPYNEKNRNVVMNPQMSDARDVSRYESVDLCFARFLYAFNAVDIANPQTYDDLQRLEIGRRYVKYYSGYVYQGDSCATSDLMETNRILHTNYKLEGGNIRQGLAMQGKHQGWSQYLFSEFFKDLSVNQLTEYCRMPASLEKYNSYYVESIPIQKWQIGEDVQEIAGYQCQKATCYFRGRSYTAWFTVEIPISHGPWKFGGLPGLILKVYDDRQEYVFECVGIEQYTQEYPIIRLDNYKAYRETTRSKLDKLLKSVCENYYQLTGMTNAPSQLLHPYNPMELE